MRQETDRKRGSAVVGLQDRYVQAVGILTGEEVGDTLAAQRFMGWLDQFEVDRSEFEERVQDSRVFDVDLWETAWWFASNATYIKEDAGACYIVPDAAACDAPAVAPHEGGEA